MRVAAVVPPGRFPTVVSDPGPWWGSLAAHDLSRYSVNAAWWQCVCNENAADLLQVAPARSVHRRRFSRTTECDLRPSGRAASEALLALQDASTFSSTRAYVDTVTRIAEHLMLLNDAQDELIFDLSSGVHVDGVDYADSQSLVDYASEDSPLSSLITHAIASAPTDIDLLLLSVTTPQDLLTALVAARLFRIVNPDMHVSLIDHGYENFTLRPHMETLRRSGHFTRIFDTIVVSKDARDVLVPWLAASLAAGSAPRGYLDRPATALNLEPELPYVAPPPVPTFSPEPVFWTRISKRRCYWSRCNFCIQNLKYDDPLTPELSEVNAAVDRLERLYAAGYRTCIFSDEALSPSLVRKLSQLLIARDIQIRWACRCKLELNFTAELFDLMRRAGCYEVLFGLESISPRVQQLMDKHVDGLDADRVRRIFSDAGAAGIGLHINLLAGFPGDTLEDTHDTVDFVIEAAAPLSNVTVTLNAFALFPDTPVAKDPLVFGVEPLPHSGDMPEQLPFRLFGPAAQTALVHHRIPALATHLMTELGWADVAATIGGAAAVELYFATGHGSIFKSMPSHGMANPLGTNAATVPS